MHTHNLEIALESIKNAQREFEIFSNRHSLQTFNIMINNVKESLEILREAQAGYLKRATKGRVLDAFQH